MAYIGKQPVVGNFQVCDAISVVNGQAAYTMQVASANVEPENANHMLVSLNGVLQKPGSSFTISGATITFASNLVTNDVIDFIILLGDTLNVGTPSDNGVTTASIAANAVTGAKLNTDVISAQTALTSSPADTDEFLVSDAGTLKRIDYSLIKGGGNTVKLGETNITSGTSAVTFDGLFTSDYPNYKLIITDLVLANAQNLRMRVLVGGSEQTGNNYYSAHMNVGGSSSGGSADASRDWGSSSFQLSNYNISTNTREVSSWFIEIPNPLYAASNPTFSQQHNINNSNSSTIIAGTGGYFYYVATAISGVKIFAASGNINYGNFYLYGIKN